MAQIDSYLRRISGDWNVSFLEDYYDLYADVDNLNVRKIFAYFQTRLNELINIINQGIRTEQNEEGEVVYAGGYVHAQDSRDYLEIISRIDSIRSKLSDSPYAFRLSDANYDDFIRRTRRFIAKSGGSSIPNDFRPLETEDLKPIFTLTERVSVGTSSIQNVQLQLIGEGSYAQVFKYIDPTYDIPVVIKRAKIELDCKELERFKQEFCVLKRLNSPYVITVYTYDDVKNEYTMEFMDDTIYNYIKKNNDKISLAERKSIIAQICKGLNYIHSIGLLHRDISLANVFIKRFEDVNVIKIGDFGLVKNPENNLTSLQSEIKGSLNDPALINVGFSNYGIIHETFALTRLCYYVLTGKTNIDKEKNDILKKFWDKGTSTNVEERYKDVDELFNAVLKVSDVLASQNCS